MSSTIKPQFSREKHLLPAYRTYFPPRERLHATATARYRIWKEEGGNLMKLYNRYIDKSGTDCSAWYTKTENPSCVDLLRYLNAGKVPGPDGTLDPAPFVFELIPDPNREGIYCIHVKHQEVDPSSSRGILINLANSVYYSLPFFGADRLGVDFGSCGWEFAPFARW